MGQNTNIRPKVGLKQRTASPPPAHPTGVRPTLALVLPLTFTLLLLALGLLPVVRKNPHLLWSFCGAGAVLLVWNAVTLVTARRQGRTLAVEVVLRRQHYMQVFAQLSILLYWGWYWRVVYDSAPLFAAQLVFAYAFDALLSWSRRDTYTFGFGPFPIVLSANFFLWFKPDWFYLQFVLVAVGFAAKELIRWNKDGRQTHIFNPSSFALALFSVILLVTGTTGITWGPEISNTQFNPPHIFLLIFLVSLPAQFLFGVAPMTLAAVATTYTFCLLYFATTGVHYFSEQPIPISVFLGMHLLFTDPSTSPRTELGRIIFGVLYGLSVVGIVPLLAFWNLPVFYDKLLPVPFLNLMIRGIDKASRSNLLKRFDPLALGRGLMPHPRNLAYMSVWAVVFVTMQVQTGAQATLVRGDLLLEQGRIEEAIARFREFLQTDPADAEGHYQLGTALMQAGRLDEAIPSLQRAIELQPNSAKTYDNLGAALLQAGRSQDAVASLQRAIELQPNNPKAQNNLGLALTKTGRVQEAVAALRHAVELQPDSSEAQNNLGQALMQAGQFADAVSAYQRAVELQPNSPEAHDKLGQALMQAGRFADATATLHREVELQPNNPDARGHLGLALMQMGRFADAVTSLQHAVELKPDYPEAHDYLGQALLQSGQLKEAVASLHRAVDLKPDDPEAHYNLAHALATLGEPRAAVGQLREALRLRPDWPLALASLAGLEATGSDAVRDPGEAVRLASRAADLSGRRDAYILDVLGAAYAAAGRFGEAARTAEAAEALASGSAPDLAAQIRSHLTFYRTNHRTKSLEP